MMSVKLPPLPDPMLTIAGDDPDRTRWYSEAQMREYANDALRSLNLCDADGCTKLATIRFMSRFGIRRVCIDHLELTR